MVNPSELLSGVPLGLREPLIQRYQEIGSNYLEHLWEPSELNGGKFCEVAFTIVDGFIKGVFPGKPAKPRDMTAACRALESIAPDPNRLGDRSLRVLIPRAILVLYEIRNNRGVGHVGGDVDPNYLDATAVYAIASWILAEIIRISHKITTAEAQQAIDSLVEHKSPLVWEVEGVKRVLDPAMSKSDQALLLLHSRPAWVSEKDLADWVEYSNLGVFREQILLRLHKLRLVEYDAAGYRARISPLGAKEVEQRILKDRI
ncbi:MAG: hypothetical protein HY396_01355 [Candidatus Doudnabacteria bacterium]|nr:hypothetical protein [Candidatus Doudnabacteria bacterium]